jgi:hypothetical protein
VYGYYTKSTKCVLTVGWQKVPDFGKKYKVFGVNVLELHLTAFDCAQYNAKNTRSGDLVL